MTRVKTPRSAAGIRRVVARLRAQHPNAFTELNFRNPYELLVATILSAQCTDERVNKVTPALFAQYPNATALSAAKAIDLEAAIKSTGFFRSKAKSLGGMAMALVERHAAEVPSQMTELVKLPGVGRKTANVVLGHAFGIPGLPVDRHVLRVADRLALAKGGNAEAVERELCAALPEDLWTVASDTLILHGRRVCKPKPLCGQCHARTDCPARVEPGDAVRPSRKGTRR